MKQITCPHCGDTYPDFDVAHVCSKGLYAPKLKPKMNERIKLLAEQVGAVQNVLAMGRHDGVLFTETELEKFAELIVRECSKIIVNGGYRNPALGGKYPLTPPEIATMIKEHFGVEE